MITAEDARYDPVSAWDVFKAKRAKIIDDFMEGDSVEVLRARLKFIGYHGVGLETEIRELRERRDALPLGTVTKRIVARIERMRPSR